MKNSDLDCILPLVAKPIRYTGGELNSAQEKAKGERIKDEVRNADSSFIIHPSSFSEVTVALCLPDVYEIGMSNYGLRVLYGVLNRKEYVTCERVYTPWPDMADKLKAASIPLYSLESHRPLREFGILGFSLQSELSLTNVLYTLDLAEIPLHSDARSKDDPLVIAGGPVCVNPLPMKQFIDCFVIGDGEEVIAEIADVCRDWNHADRAHLLKTLADIEGVYVPLVHKTGKPFSVRSRRVSELREEDFPHPPILSTCEIVHDRLTIEIARGCTRGCRFCQAGMLNRPYRCRPVDEIVRLADRGIQATGWEEVSLLSLSSLDYPNLYELVSRLNATLEQKRVSISLPSVRGEDFTPELAVALKQVRKTGLTFAPETISPRLRAMVNKHISEEKILESVRTAAEAGWHGVKLYFMIGLPGETANDVLEIRRFVEEVARAAHNVQVRFNLSPFVPKPHTPLQWVGFEPTKELEQKIELLKGGPRRRSIKAKWESPELSCIQAVIARGDERLGPVLERVYRRGGVFQEWTEYFSYALWQQAFSEVGVDMEQYLKPKQENQPTPDTDERSVAQSQHRLVDGFPTSGARHPTPNTQPLAPALPWDFIDVGVSKEFLRREYVRAQTGEFTPDCREAGCFECGIEDCRNHLTPDTQHATPSTQPPTPEIDYGRYPRKITMREELKLKFRVRFSVGEAFRYAGHLDIVRSFYRTLRRSRIPVAYSQGFAPRPVVAFGPPKPVGLTSAEEFLDLQMAGHYPGDLMRELGPAMPRDMTLLEVRPVLSRVESLGAALTAARYRVEARGLSEEECRATAERSRTTPGVIKFDMEDQTPTPDAQHPTPIFFRVTLSLAPGTKLFMVLPQLFARPEPEVRCWRIERETCHIVRDGKLMSPMEGL